MSEPREINPVQFLKPRNMQGGSHEWGNSPRSDESDPKVSPAPESAESSPLDEAREVTPVVGMHNAQDPDLPPAPKKIRHGSDPDAVLEPEPEKAPLPKPKVDPRVESLAKARAAKAEKAALEKSGQPGSSAKSASAGMEQQTEGDGLVF
jgi:hypothetical protein